MRSFEKEGSWSLSFSGAGFQGLYYVGVTQCLRQRAPRLLQGAGRFYGSSSGALGALSVVGGKSAYFCSSLLGMIKHVEQLSLGVFHPAFAPIEYIRQELQDNLPADIHILASQRLGISITHWPDGQNCIVTDFATRDEVIQVLNTRSVNNCVSTDLSSQAVICSLYVPFYCGTIPPMFRGERYIDGGFSNNLPFADSPSVITVSPFHGTVDICPQSTSASMHELNIFNVSFQICTQNFYLGLSSLIPLSPEAAGALGNHCDRDALDGLTCCAPPPTDPGLTKEPVLWTLVSKEPPAPADGNQDAGHDGELSFNCAVPNVLVKDVPNFEQLSPELEAALKEACMRDPSPWASLCQSGPGRALTYLLLPCTLPFEYVYFRSRRLVAWLPEVPADLWWMQAMLRSLALSICSRTKNQLLGLVRLLVPSPLHHEAAPPTDLTKEPRSAHQV
ncbi:Patatin-like phospholipase domain-containing protein 5 [Camelus dromedarius]|uniref:Patatin-like phospholipase domain-containing protein 5 n=1 Tax=Camelus dromedarius TaxID=9838 RepID=A0A5N4DEK1_CAMDR|nr:Patatin-like phospholipase domain-containing protein 5 [Camelus dromedarius]